MLASPLSLSSKRLTCTSVAWKDAPCGSHRSTISSGRLDGGKNCCCTKRNPNMDNANTATVIRMTVLRQATHQFTSARKWRQDRRCKSARLYAAAGNDARNNKGETR